MKDAKAKIDIRPAPGTNTILSQRMASETAAMTQSNPQIEYYYSNFVPSALTIPHADASQLSWTF